MGGRCSTIQRSGTLVPSGNRPYFMLVINKDWPVNKLKLVQADKHVVHLIQKAVGEVCEPGVYSFGKDHDGSFEVLNNLLKHIFFIICNIGEISQHP